MNLASAADIKKLLEKYSTKPFKGLGQNFLINKEVLEKIVTAANLKKSETILEIGPGIGSLTLELAKKAKKVVAIEKDKKLFYILKKMAEEFKNIEIIEGDVLKRSGIKRRVYKVVANLPYNISAPIIRKFLEAENPPKEMVLMVQKEVAQRICAKPPEMNILAVSVQFYSEPKILFYVSKNNFWPRPKVDGAIIKLKLRCEKWKADKSLFFRIAKAGFSQPRKQISNNLSKMLKLNKEKVKNWLLINRIQPSQRAETLNLEDWIELTKSYIINQ